MILQLWFKRLLLIYREAIKASPHPMLVTLAKHLYITSFTRSCVGSRNQSRWYSVSGSSANRYDLS